MYQSFETSQKPVSMTITVNEALRLKNEMSSLLNSVQAVARQTGMLGRQSRLVYGDLVEDGLAVEPERHQVRGVQGPVLRPPELLNEINTEISSSTPRTTSGSWSANAAAYSTWALLSRPRKAKRTSVAGATTWKAWDA